MSEQFDEQGNNFETDDVEAHRIPKDVEGAGEDTEGHRFSLDKAGIEVEEDDVEGHKFVQPRRDTDNQGNQF